MRVRHADRDDFPWLLANDRHVDGAWVSRCIANGEYLICTFGIVRIGFLRYSLFWGAIPYMDMIHVLAPYRNGGAGTALLAFWELEMRGEGARVLMTSATANEDRARRWHRRNGFETSGELTFGRHDPTPETFFIKNL